MFSNTAIQPLTLTSLQSPSTNDTPRPQLRRHNAMRILPTSQNYNPENQSRVIKHSVSNSLKQIGENYNDTEISRKHKINLLSSPTEQFENNCKKLKTIALSDIEDTLLKKMPIALKNFDQATLRNMFSREEMTVMNEWFSLCSEDFDGLDYTPLQARNIYRGLLHFIKAPEMKERYLDINKTISTFVKSCLKILSISSIKLDIRKLIKIFDCEEMELINTWISIRSIDPKEHRITNDSATRTSIVLNNFISYLNLPKEEGDLCKQNAINRLKNDVVSQRNKTKIPLVTITEEEEENEAKVY